MLTLARLPEHVSMLNHTRVLPAERQNAEMYYLGRIAKELAAVGETEEEEVLRRHGRWGVLCEREYFPDVAAFWRGGERADGGG
jgi:hypothetical protein